ncbi:hypothetical protein HT102_15735 [Hoyosella sp. G463]|uniref:AMIN-like domain-containing protein n=1 Tax=Lolliginicoccus lacisalsi TaxID=2742202 RepID=A0A927JEM5_9ACTN|nr:hypothetical protein [Lolliginicoccus lacisalsi]MBD8507939.1 hypothetical protein [Lolliginicoccus lacisalsi]
MNLRHMRRSALVVPAILILGIAGCGSDDADLPASVTTPEMSPQSAATGADLPDEEPGATENVPSGPEIEETPLQPAPSRPDNNTSRGGSGSAFSGTLGPAAKQSGDGTFLSVTGIRVGEHNGFTRIVVDLAGQGDQPGYDLRYVDAAYAAGSGDPIAVSGDAILAFNVTGWGYPFDTGVDPYSGPKTIGGPASGSVAEIEVGTFNEGVAQMFVGVRGGQREFTAMTLTNPPRVVLDISD